MVTGFSRTKNDAPFSLMDAGVSLRLNREEAAVTVLALDRRPVGVVGVSITEVWIRL